MSRWSILIFLCCILVKPAIAVSFRVSPDLPEAVQDNVQLYLDNLNFNQNTSQRRITRLTTEQVRTALRALGYYQHSIEVQLLSDDEYQINIELGTPLNISELLLDVRGEGEHDPAFIKVVNDTPLRSGGHFRHDDYLKLKRDLSRVAAQKGYFDASFVQSSVEVSLKNNQAKVEIVYDTASRYFFGELIFSNQAIPDSLFNHPTAFETHQPYEASLVGEYNQELAETDYFAVSSVRPDIEHRHQQQVDLLIDLALKPKDIFEVGGGLTTDIGPRIKFKWTRPWVNNRGHSLGFETEASVLQQSGTVNYRIPYKTSIRDYIDLSVGGIREANNDTESNRALLSASRQTKVNKEWTRSYSLRYEYEDFRQADQFSTSHLILPGISATMLESRGGLDPTWGNKVQASVEVSDPLWGSDVTLAKATAYFKVIRSEQDHRLLLRGELGAILVDDIQTVPASMRFFAGGDQSVRGYDYKTIAPKNESGELIGGRYLSVFSGEYNYTLNDDWRVALFADMGNVSNDGTVDFQRALGFGIRWLTIMGSVRFDFAKGLDNPSDPWRIHFSMGPDL